MVGVLPWGEHRRAPRNGRSVCVEGIGLGLTKVLLGLGPLPDPISGERRLPEV